MNKRMMFFALAIGCAVVDHVQAKSDWHMNAQGIEVDDEGYPKPIRIDVNGNEIPDPLPGELAKMRADAKALGDEQRLLPLIAEYEIKKLRREELFILPRRQTPEEHAEQARLIEEIAALHTAITEKKREDEKVLGLPVEVSDPEPVDTYPKLIKQQFIEHPYRSTAIVLGSATFITLAVDVAIRGKKSLLGRLFYDADGVKKDGINLLDPTHLAE